MPRAKKRCSRVGCREFHPCPTHRQPFAGYRKGDPKGVPSDWKTLRRQAAGFRTKTCQICGVHDPTGEVDHIIPRSQGGAEHPSNYRWLCKPCHTDKTKGEQAATAPPPNGCRWCGTEQRGHGQRWVKSAGMHKWTAPTDRQRLARMKARRAQKKTPRP